MVEDIADKLMYSRVFELNEENKTDTVERGEIDMLPEMQSKLAPIKITREEFTKTLKCQRAMLVYMLKQYKKALGTEKEEQAQKLYNDSLIDYDEFIKQHACMFLEDV